MTQTSSIHELDIAYAPVATDPHAAASEWLSQGRPVALATVIETWGSAAVPTGGQMAIAGEEMFQGSVSGGCVEADVIAAALDVIESGVSQTLAFGITDETAWRAGLACGGKVRVHVTRLMPGRDDALFQKISAARAKRTALVIETRLKSGAHKVLTRSDEVSTDVATALDSGVCQLVSVDGDDVFLHALTPPPRLVIVGATHIAQVLVTLCNAVGYDVTVLDPRGAFTSNARFAAGAVTTAWPEAQLAQLLDDPFSSVVTLTHAANIDDEALEIALRSSCRYIGALGSRKTHEKRLARLAAAGFGDADLQRIKAPVGLDIGAKSAGEIAVAILGQVIAAFRDGRVR